MSYPPNELTPITAGMVLGNYKPKGTRFEQDNRQFMLVLNNEPRTELHGWLLEFKLDRWFTVRKATDKDIHEISKAVSLSFHRGY